MFPSNDADHAPYIRSIRNFRRSRSCNNTCHNDGTPVIVVALALPFSPYLHLLLQLSSPVAVLLEEAIRFLADRSSRGRLGLHVRPTDGLEAVFSHLSHLLVCGCLIEWVCLRQDEEGSVVSTMYE